MGAVNPCTRSYLYLKSLTTVHVHFKTLLVHVHVCLSQISEISVPVHFEIHVNMHVQLLQDYTLYCTCTYNYRSTVCNYKYRSQEVVGGGGGGGGHI